MFHILNYWLLNFKNNLMTTVVQGSTIFSFLFQCTKTTIVHIWWFKCKIYKPTLISGHIITWRSWSGWRTDMLLRSSGWLSKFARIDTASVRGELSNLSVLLRTVLQACMRSNISRDEPGNWRDKNLGPRYLKQVLRTDLDELFKAEKQSYI